MEWKETILKIGDEEFKTVEICYNDFDEWREATNPDATISLTDEHINKLMKDFDKETPILIKHSKNDE